MKKSKKIQLVKEMNCLNCGYPFAGGENFCPECGQENKDKRITFKEFIHEIFNGFISWDAKFWSTLIPLLIKPGKVSKDYINGKRQRYSNPFQFYLLVSVLFFLLLGAANSYEQFNELRVGKIKKENTALDSIKNGKNKEVNQAFKALDSINKATAYKNTRIKNDKNSFLDVNFDNINPGKFDRFINFQKKHPYIAIDDALDSLKIEKTFFNRFLYNRTEKFYNTLNKGDDMANFKKQVFSYMSISLFILLPFFTLFLKLFYIRRKYTYVEHLIFVFHTQTVFFLLLIIFYLLTFISNSNAIKIIFFLLFLLYLFLAMKNFYKQGYFKTFIKFCLLNFVYVFIGSVGMIALFAAAFLLY